MNLCADQLPHMVSPSVMAHALRCNLYSIPGDVDRFIMFHSCMKDGTWVHPEQTVLKRNHAKCKNVAYLSV